MKRFIHILQILGANFFIFILLGCSPSPHQTSSLGMVSASHPLAVEAGLAMLKAGGNAMDAALAAQIMLNLVEPQSSGIGGGGFLLYWDEKRQVLVTYDGRETAPQGAKPNLFLDDDGKPVPFLKAVFGGQSVGVPSLLALLSKAHKDYGVLAWQDLFAPTIKAGRNGFPISRRLAQWIKKDRFLKQTAARDIFFDEEGKPFEQGAIIRNLDFADFLKRIRDEGSAIFYQGAIARQIVKAVGGKNLFSQQDLARYQPKIRKNLCGFYRGYKICSMPPPSSGGISLLQILGVLSHFDMKSLAPLSPSAVHIISQASRLAYADRAHYIADPDFFQVPIGDLLSPLYLKKRALLIDKTKARRSFEAGVFSSALPPPAQKEYSLPSTTHISVIDGANNAVSLTSSIEGPFGSHIFVNGFFLNNELTDFSFYPTRNGKKIANAVEGGKRPLSSMTPVVIFAPDGSLFAVLGSPGGRRIIAYVAQTIIALIDWGMDMQSAIDLPRHTALGVAGYQGDVIELERGTALEAIKPALEAMGHKVQITPITSGLHGIKLNKRGKDGGADPRRDGVARQLQP